MRTVVATDFDGTLTRKDTLIEFIRYAKGDMPCLFGFLLHLPWLLLMKMHLYSNWKCKQRVFTYFFRGMKVEEFARLGESFGERIDLIKRDDTIRKIDDLRRPDTIVYVVSASIEQWVRPWCRQRGYETLCTQIETDHDGIITGRFSSPNCYGSEKVRRLQAVEPHREEYYLYAFGDSRGDAELLRFADKGELL